MLTKRQRLIIQRLVGAPQGITSEMISSELGVSVNSIRSDVRAIGEYLKETHGGTIEKKPGVGMILHLQSGWELVNDLRKDYDRTEQRKHFILKRILCAPSYENLTMSKLADEMYLSRSSLSREFVLVEEWLNKFELRVEKRKNAGISLVGREFDRRRAIAELCLLKMYTLKDAEQIKIGELNLGQIDVLFTFAPGVDIKKIQNLIAELEGMYSKILTHQNYIILLIHIALSMTRSAGGFRVEPPIDGELCGKEWFLSYRLEIQDVIAKILGAPPKNSELTYIAQYVVFSDMLKQTCMGYLRDEIIKSEKFAEFLNDFRHIIQTVSQVDILKDSEFVEFFRGHLAEVICRIKYRITCKNPLLGDIKKSYSGLFGVCWSTSILFERYYNIIVNDDEIAFLTIYLVIAQQQIMNRLSVCVVCNYGVSVCQLLCERIKLLIPDIQDVRTMSVQQYERCVENGENNWDFVISATKEVKIPQNGVYVNPILTQDDERCITDFMRRYKSRNFGNVEQSGYFQDEKTLLCPPSLVLEKIDANNKNEVINKLYNALLLHDYVDPEFEQSVINRENSISTELGSGFAIPHGNPQFVRRSAVAVATLKKPVEWAENEIVDIVFMVACKSGDGDNEVAKAELDKLKPFYKMLALILDDVDVQKELRGENSKNRICSLINNS